MAAFSSASAEQYTAVYCRPHRVQTLPGRLQKLKLVSGLMPRSGWAASRLVHAEASTPQHPAKICAKRVMRRPVVGTSDVIDGPLKLP